MPCPRCGSDNISPAERDYQSDYPFAIVLAVAFLLLGGALAAFFLLQLHPVILILVILAVAGRLLKERPRRPKERVEEYICLDCRKRWKEKVLVKGVSSEEKREN
ncbi:MAG: hypothetical protein ACOC57_04770 [Acidobacteriota bacterium]